MQTQAPDNIRIWLATTSAFAPLLALNPAPIFATLSAPECARYRATVSRDAGLHFLLGRYLLRHALSASCGGQIAPAAWEITADPGKPRVLHRSAPGFSISHSDGVVAVALSHRLEPGLDIEPLSRNLGAGICTRQLLSPVQYKALQAIPAAKRGALLARAWCIKEAVSKAFGLGLRLPFAELDFDLAPPEAAEPACWQRGTRLGQGSFWFRLPCLERYRLCLALIAPTQSPPELPGISLVPFTCPGGMTGPAAQTTLAADLISL
ncbi:4'-phosphopantetheinyl transferase family protein [Marinobacterium sedimentorum]|uniref:4'-phosphopantetheinyl transferase family protein n=1 Tax=Marinobacterium sedimentorum TaxID=2927804 RepID=UPI0020C5DCE5|nr:4'-phosphopantetheinyl transferase superfamily protein [Marinobacterium sedimentorum]MCP8689647.1 4'-phosphopantetheinyl transferase superfamily protein [Marinobacterium sedimentorum]